MTKTSGYCGMVSIYATNEDGSDMTYPIYTSDIYPTREEVFNEFGGSWELIRSLVEESRVYHDFDYDCEKDRPSDECVTRFAEMLKETRTHFDGNQDSPRDFDYEDIHIAVHRPTIHTEPKTCCYALITSSDPSSGRLIDHSSVHASREGVLRELINRIAEIGHEIADHDSDIQYLGNVEYAPGKEYSDDDKRRDFNEASLRSWLEIGVESGCYENGLIEIELVSDVLRE